MLDIAIANDAGAERSIALRGRLDTLTTPRLDAALAPLLGSPAVTSLVFRVEGLEYVSSAGLRCLIHADRVLTGRGGGLALVAPQPEVQRVLDIVKALPPGRIYASEAALAARGTRPAPRGEA